MSRVSSPRCVLCTALVGAKQAKQTAYLCSTCTVPLCTISHGRQKSSCFQRWHSVADLAGVLKEATVSGEKKSGKKKRTIDGIVASPQRKSPRLSRFGKLSRRLKGLSGLAGVLGETSDPAKKKKTANPAKKKKTALNKKTGSKKKGRKRPACNEVAASRPRTRSRANKS